MSLIRQMRGGKDYDSKWGERQAGTGPYAWQMRGASRSQSKKLGLGYRSRDGVALHCSQFRVPGRGKQLALL